MWHAKLSYKKYVLENKQQQNTLSMSIGFLNDISGFLDMIRSTMQKLLKKETWKCYETESLF